MRRRLQRAGRRLGAARAGHDGVGSVRRRRRFRRRAGTGGGRDRAACSAWTRRAVRRDARAGGAGRPRLRSRCSPIRCAARWPRSGRARRRRRAGPAPGRGGPGGRSTCWPPRGCHGSIHIGCEAASFARDVGLYRGHGYAVEQMRVFDSFPLTHHVECVAVLTRVTRTSGSARSSAATGRARTTPTDIAVTTAPLRVNSQNEIGMVCARGDAQHHDVGAGADGGQVAAEVRPEGQRPPQRLRLWAGSRTARGQLGDDRESSSRHRGCCR